MEACRTIPSSMATARRASRSDRRAKAGSTMVGEDMSCKAFPPGLFTIRDHSQKSTKSSIVLLFYFNSTSQRKGCQPSVPEDLTGLLVDLLAGPSALGGDSPNPSADKPQEFVKESPKVSHWRALMFVSRCRAGTCIHKRLPISWICAILSQPSQLGVSRSTFTAFRPWISIPPDHGRRAFLIRDVLAVPPPVLMTAGCSGQDCGMAVVAGNGLVPIET